MIKGKLKMFKGERDLSRLKRWRVNATHSNEDVQTRTNIPSSTNKKNSPVGTTAAAAEEDNVFIIKKHEQGKVTWCRKQTDGRRIKK